LPPLFQLLLPKRAASPLKALSCTHMATEKSVASPKRTSGAVPRVMKLAKEPSLALLQKTPWPSWPAA
jgi:hypothetical protein